MGAEPYFFCLDTKETKNQASRNASLPHRPLPCKPGKTWAGKVCGHIAHTASCAAKISYALLRARPPSFCLISPEAVLLTGSLTQPLSKGEGFKL